jgi:flagellar basal-body rod protein FlgB
MLQEVLFNKTKIPILLRMQNVSAFKQRTIANNIANVAVPDYRRKDVEFKEYLNQAKQSPHLRIARTHPMHLPVTTDLEGLRVVESMEGENTTGINNVDVDTEMAELAQNQLMFNIEVTLMGRAFQGLQKAIRGRVQ